MRHEVARTKLGHRFIFDIFEQHIEVLSVSVIGDYDEGLDVSVYGNIEVTGDLLAVVSAFYGVTLEEDVETALVPSHMLLVIDYDEFDFTQPMIIDPVYVEAEPGTSPYVKMKGAEDVTATYSNDLLDMIHVAVGMMGKDLSYKFGAKVTAVQQ